MRTTTYKTVWTNDLAGLRRAEWLHTHGWKTHRVGMFTETFKKMENQK